MVAPLIAVANEIAALKPSYPQLVDFPAKGFVFEREVSYQYRASPDPSIKAGWRRGFPLPHPDGVVISIRLVTPDERGSLQEAFPPIGRFGDDWAIVHVFDGKNTKPLVGPVFEIMKRHGYRPEP